MKRNLILGIAGMVAVALVLVLVFSGNKEVAEEETIPVEETPPIVEEPVEEMPVEETTTEHTVRMVDFAFEPSSLTIKQGDTVTWVNEGRGPHYVLSIKGIRVLDSKNIKSGESWSYTFNEEPGKYEYFSPIYSGMFGIIIIE